MNNEDDIKNVAIYVRVSTKDQAKDGYSLGDQLDRLRAFCKARRWEISKEYIDDGYSGRKIKNRPRYQQMMKDTDHWDTIVCIKGDRIHRNIMNFLGMQIFLNNNDKGYVSVSEGYDTTTPGGRMIMRVLASMAEYESEQLGERTFIGMKKKARTKDRAKNKDCVGHGAPFGYKVVRAILEDGTLSSHIESVPEELEIVKKMYELALQDTSINKIRKILNQPFSRVHYILHNPWYAGWEKWLNEIIKGRHESVVDTKVWNKIQRKISKRVYKGDVRSAPLQLPTDTKTAYVQLSKEDYFTISSIRNIGNRKPKHDINF